MSSSNMTRNAFGVNVDPQNIAPLGVMRWAGQIAKTGGAEFSAGDQNLTFGAAGEFSSSGIALPKGKYTNWRITATHTGTGTLGTVRFRFGTVDITLTALDGGYGLSYASAQEYTVSAQESAEGTSSGPYLQSSGCDGDNTITISVTCDVLPL